MRRLLFATLLTLLTAAVLAPAASARMSYCSPSGELCYSASYGGDGEVYLTLNLAAKYFNTYRLCVTPAGYRAGRECKRFQILRRANGSYGSTVRWSRHFTNEGGGNYHARYKSPYGKLGPRVTFRR